MNPDIPQWLVDIIDRLMSKQPNDRIQDAAELAKLLGSHLAHLQDPDNVPAPVGVEPKPAPRPRALKSLLLAMLMIGGIGLGITEAVGVTNVSEFLGIVLRLKTPEGTLIVEIEDPDVEVSVDGSEVVLSGITKKELRLKPGKYQYRTTRKGEPVESDWVTIERDGKTVVRIQQLPPKSQTTAGAGQPKRETQSAWAVDPNLGIVLPETPSPSPEAPINFRQSIDGVAFAVPVQVQRFGISVPVVARTYGEFLDVPQQLWGQRCAAAIGKGGQLAFKVTSRAFGGQYQFAPRDGGTVTQRLWLLMPDRDRGEVESPDGFAFDTRESLIEAGWQSWRTLKSYRVLVDLEDEKNQLKWSVFYRDAEPNESFSVRAHWDHRPLLVWGSVKLNDIVVDAAWDQRVATFGAGASVSLGNGDHFFDKVPEFLDGRLYTKRNGYQGIARFTVHRPQRVIVGLYDWRFMNAGNASGGWREELTSPEKLKQQGWELVTTLEARNSNPDNPSASWYFYARDCKAGERFELRNHKYQAPIVFSEKTNSEAGPVEIEEFPLDQHARIQAEERLAKLVEEFNSMIKLGRFAEAKTIAERAKREFPNGPAVDALLHGIRIGQPPVSVGASTAPVDDATSSRPLDDTPIANPMPQPSVIRLDSSKIKTQLADRIGESAVFGTHGPATRHGGLPVKFFARKTEARSDGYGLLVGQIPVTTRDGDRFELERFERIGNQLRVVFRQHTTNPAFCAATNRRGVFRDLSAEQTLIAALSRSETKVNERLSNEKRQKQLLNPRGDATPASEPDLGGILLSRVINSRHLADLVQNVALLYRARAVPQVRVKQARNALLEELEWHRTQLQRISPGIDIDAAEAERIQQAEEGLTKTEFRLAMCTREEAMTHSTESRQYETLMRQAAAEFGKVYTTHRSQIVGLESLLWQAGCLCRVGEFELVSRYSKQVLKSQPAPNWVHREIQPRAMQLLLISMIDGHLDTSKHAIETAEEWLSNADTETRRSNTGSCIMWEQARAMYIASLPENSELPYPTTSGLDISYELVGRLRRMTYSLLKSPRISAEPFKKQAATLATMLRDEFPSAAADIDSQKQSLFFATPLPTLPPGNYDIKASVRVMLHPAFDEPEDPLDPESVEHSTIPSPEETVALTGKLSVPVSDPDAAEFKRVAVLAVVLKPAENEAFGRQMSSSLNIDLAELITRMGQLEDVKGLPGDPERLRHYLDDLSQAGKKWAMCAALDLENADSKIHAARALAKLADPDTVAVLLIAAKRNAYGIMGSENVTIHSLYQAELKLALEAATGLKLTPPGLTLTYEHRDELPPRTVVHRSELNPEMFRSETDFKRVDNWLRSVYLADSEVSAVPQPDAEGTIPTAKSIHTGLVGRMSIRTLISNGPGRSSTSKHVDPGYIFQYPPGQFFHRDVLPLKQIKDRSFVVNLTGQLDVPRDMVVKIWHAGGGVSHDECGLYVDGALLGVVGDDREKHNIYEVPLLKGRHNVRWELSGGTFRTNILLFQDPETKSYLPIINSGPESARKASADRVVLIQSSRTDWPVSAKPDWLPESVVITEPEPATTGTLP